MYSLDKKENLQTLLFIQGIFNSFYHLKKKKIRDVNIKCFGSKVQLDKLYFYRFTNFIYFSKLRATLTREKCFRY